MSEWFWLWWPGFKYRWLPYRTSQLLGVSEETGELLCGPWVWHWAVLARWTERRRLAELRRLGA